MYRFSSIPPPFLSVTACGLISASVVQRLAVSPSPVVLAWAVFVGRRPQRGLRLVLRRCRSSALAFRVALRGWRLAVLAVPVVGLSTAWVRGSLTRRAPWVGGRPATVVAASTRLPPAALTRRSTPLLSVAGRCAIKPRSAG